MENVWVIKDYGENYISLRENSKGKYFVRYNGIASGFSFYKDENVAKQKLIILTSEFDDNFSLELIDLNSIPKGERIDNGKNWFIYRNKCK